jgi:hypothetical protein
MTPYEVYIDYLALKRHFTTDSYDYHKYNGKVKAKKESFEKRKDKFFFEKISRHRDPHGLMLANFLKSDDIWVKNLTGDEASEQYNKWLGKLQSISRSVENELSVLDDDFDSNFKVLDGKHPNLLKLYLADKLSIETFIIVYDLVGCESYWNNKLKNDFIWDEVKKKIKKVRPFLVYDKTKIKNIIVEKFRV